ncbi:MAG: hypothetical protein ACM3XM_14175 [Mycobacterium leprae]
MESSIRRAQATDIPAIVQLSELKRVQYETYQPLFWRKAVDSEAKQTLFLQQVLSREQAIALVHEQNGQVDGYIIAALVPSPPVYTAGLTCFVDDYWVANGDWSGVGAALLASAAAIARERGATQCNVVSGHLDEAKRAMLSAVGHTIASEWWVKPL